MSARGSNSRVTTLNETVYGTTPAIIAGDSAIVPVISNNVNLTKALFDDPSIYPDSQKRFTRHGNKGISGDISVVYTVSNFDPWLESLMQDTWTANVLKFGTTKKSFTIERGFLDITQYAIYTGMTVDSFSLEVNTDGVIQSTFSFIGQSMTLVQTAQDSAPTASTSAEPFVHLDGIFKENDVSAGCTLLGISMNVSKGLDQLYCLGNDEIKEPAVSMIEVSGTATFFFDDNAMLDKFINETESSLEFTLDDGSANTHTFLLPKVKYNSANIDQSDAGNIPIEMEFTCLYDVAEASTLVITRSA